MNEEEKEAIEYLKVRLYGNEGCKYIDVAQEDLRIFLKLVTRKEKELENWKKYCDEQEENITEKSNKICDLEFEIENQQLELEKKDKQIDEMAKKINEAYFESGDFEEWFENKICKVQKYEDYTYLEKDIKQYFEKKVEEDK